MIDHAVISTAQHQEQPQCAEHEAGGEGAVKISVKQAHERLGVANDDGDVGVLCCQSTCQDVNGLPQRDERGPNRAEPLTIVTWFVAISGGSGAFR